MKNTPWFYPVGHLAAAFAVGTIAALLCCAMYGWLIRFLPAPRLKAAGQLAAIVPIMAMMWQQHVRSVITGILKLVPVDPAARWALGLLGCAAAIAIAAFGIRSLSGDYLVRVSGIMRGGRAVPVRLRKTARGSLIARLFGGQPGRAGYAFVSRMMLRDYQFRRQALPTVVLGLLGLVGPLLGKWRVDPFSEHFTTMHILPHAIAFALFFFCILMPFGNDYKGVWIFLTAPGHALKGFSRGVFGSLCVPLVIVPHALLLPLLAVAWGPLHSALFVAYSLAISFLYLSLELRLIDGPPFCRQVDPTRNATALPMIILGATVVGVFVAVQLLLVFPSLTRVAITAVVAGAAAWFLTQRSLGALEASIRHNLGVVSEESGTLYREVNM